MNLYEYPEIYAALRTPQDELFEGARRALALWMPHALKSIMDPACGPANWLLPFAREGIFVAGNDLSAHMVREAQRTLAGCRAEVVQGDMRDLKFTTGPFDAAIELAGTASQLEPADLEMHLRSVAHHLVPGGIFLVTLFFEAPTARPTPPAVTWQSGLIPLASGGQTSATYEIIDWNPERRHESMRRTIRTSGVPNVPERLEDQYSVRIWHDAELGALVARTAAFTILSTDAIRDGDRDDPNGERTVALRRI